MGEAEDLSGGVWWSRASWGEDFEEERMRSGQRGAFWSEQTLTLKPSLFQFSGKILLYIATPWWSR
jgi:hypothetical protein